MADDYEYKQQSSGEWGRRKRGTQDPYQQSGPPEGGDSSRETTSQIASRMGVKLPAQGESTKPKTPKPDLTGLSLGEAAAKMKKWREENQ